MDKFRTLELMVAVVKQGSFAAAAKSLNTSPSTVSKAIERLETSVGVRLFQRTTRQLKLTVAGEAYFRKVNELLQELSDCEANLVDENSLAVGEIKISAPVSYGREYIRPLLPSFLALYPDISIELDIEDHHVDLIENNFDLAIRTGSLKDSRFIAQQLSCMDMVTCIAPKLLKTFKGGIQISRLEEYPWIHYRFKHSGKLMPLRVKKRNKVVIIEPEKKCVVNDGDVLLALCKEGVGLTQLPHFLAREALAKKQLVAVAPTLALPGAGIYLVYPSKDYMPLRVRLFIDFIKQHLTKNDETPRGTWARKLVLAK